MHTQTHPDATVPQIVKDKYPLDVSWHHDECPSFQSSDRNEQIYWMQEGDDVSFSIWEIDDEGGLTENELAQGFSEVDLMSYLACARAAITKATQE